MNRSVPLKAVLAAVVGLALLAGAFVGGMAFENHRISSELERAFGGMEEDFDAGAGDETVMKGDGADEGNAMDEPVALRRNEPYNVVTSDGGEATVILRGSTITDASGTYSGDFTRALVLEVEVRNDGATPVDASSIFSGHYETDEGEVFDFSGVMCTDDELTVETLKPGQFARGCNRHDITDESGKLVFADGTPTPFYVEAPAAP